MLVVGVGKGIVISLYCYFVIKKFGSEIGEEFLRQMVEAGIR